jgi:hydrogenase assembly chaperone HypC/HupF
MCIGIPMQVLQVRGLVADCAGRGQQQPIDLQLVGVQPVGGWVLTFQGSAIRALSAEEAAQTTAALAALDAVLAGGSIDVDVHFADLVGREPQLPDHLKGPRS